MSHSFQRTAALVAAVLALAAGCSTQRPLEGPASADSNPPVVSTGGVSTGGVSPDSLPTVSSPDWSGTGLEPAGTVADGTSHPRLWLTPADLPRLRSWATDTNPAWSNGLAVELQRVRRVVDSGAASDDGSPGWVQDPVEADAELLAFGSLVEPSPADRDADAQRARRLLMRGIQAAVGGAQDGAAYRSPSFAIDDRSRWWGEGWALTVDWIYPLLSKDDKAAIRTVFLRWSGEEERGGQTTSDHPVPVGDHDDPALLADPTNVKWSANNYFTAHARNITLMSLALDPADDPGGTLHAHLANATGGFLAMTDALLRGPGRGGAPAEGFEYGPQSLGYVAETLLALHTSGHDAAGSAGRQVTFEGNPFWDQVEPWLLNNLSPAPVTNAEGQQVWLPASYGDTQHFHNPDWIELYGALGIYDESVGTHATRLQTARWIETNTPDGGAVTLPDRIADPTNPRESIMYFMLLDPKASAPPDPRPALPKSWVAAGVGRVSARTGWDAKASWFDFGVGWNLIDHQNGDGLDIGLYRHGEWLTKERSGYDVVTSDQKNTLAIQNDPPEHADDGDYRQLEFAAGSQYTYVPTGPGQLTASSNGDGYVYASGDATNLYNSVREGSTDVVQATRDVVWLEPDVLVVYDRATTRTDGRFKRFFLQLPGDPVINGQRAVSTTPHGQQLTITTLLPQRAGLHGEAVTPDANGAIPGEGSGQVADGEPMGYRLRVEAPGNPADTRFLNVLEGGDAGAAPTVTTLVRSTAGDPFDGAIVGTTVVLFPVHTGPKNATIDLPHGASRILVTGLAASTSYRVSTTGDQLRIDNTNDSGSGRSVVTDAGGVLDLVP